MFSLFLQRKLTIEFYRFFHLERMYLEYYYKKEKRQKLSVECAFLEDSKSRSKKIVENV